MFNLMDKNTHWFNITEIDRKGKLDKTFGIIMDQFCLDDGYTEEINIADIILEEEND